MPIIFPTSDDIRALIQEELAAFFSSNKFQTKSEEAEFGGVEFASRITGKAVPTIYDLVSKRKIPHSKQGKKLYFSKKELLDWIQSGRRPVKAIVSTQIINDDNF